MVKRMKHWLLSESSPDMFAAAADGDSDGREAKRIKRDGDESRLSLESIPDDLLATEILPRLADCRAALRCSAVSKHWQSLVSAPEFVPNFLRDRRSSHAMFVEFRFHTPETCLQELCERHLIVEGSKLTAGETADYDFARAIRGHGVVFDSVCDDFFLFSSVVNDDHPTRHLHIRNAVTGQWLHLPELPVKEQEGFCALVSDPNSTLSGYSFKVVYINLMSVGGGPAQHWSTVFSSETGRWSNLARTPEIDWMPTAVAVNGQLFLLYEALGSIRLVMLDAFKGSSWRFILLPPDFLLPREFYRGSTVEFGPPHEVRHLGTCTDLPLIGAVNGRLRLAQLFHLASSGGLFVLKIWELSNSHEWRSVNRVQLRAPPFRVEETKWMYLFAFDPDDSDVIFLCCDWEVFRYHITRCEFKRAFRLWSTKEDKSVNDSLPRFAQVFTVRLPPWPTTIPALPSSSSAL